MNNTSQKKVASKRFAGSVVHGDGRGRKLGFPTANLQLDNPNNRPPDGVYACLAQILPEPDNYMATLHAGPRPTFPGAKATIEVHLIDFPCRELYGKKLQVDRLTRIRGIIKYSSSQALIKAIGEDVEKTKAILNE